MLFFRPIGDDISEGWGGIEKDLGYIDGGSMLIGGHTNGDGGTEI